VALLVGSTSLILWIIKLLVLNRIAEIFPGAAALGDIVESLFGNTIAACLFFLVFSHLPEQRARRRMRPFIQKYSDRIVGDAVSILEEFGRASGMSLDFQTVDEVTLKAALNTVSTTSHPNMVQGVANTPVSWDQYLVHQRGRSRDWIRRLLDQGRFLDADHAAMLADIDANNFFWIIDMYGMIVARGATLGWLDTPVWEYLLLVRSLEAYNKAELAA
jgi:hypothetical protein